MMRLHHLNGGPHPWEPRIEFSSPDQEPEDDYLIEESRPEAEAHEEQESAPFEAVQIPPPVFSDDNQNIEQEMEALPPPQVYEQSAQLEQQEEAAEDEEDTSEASQASEIEVKPSQDFVEEYEMKYEEQPPVSQPETVGQ